MATTVHDQDMAIVHEPRCLDPTLNHAALPVDQPQLDQALQVKGMAETVADAHTVNLGVSPRRLR